MDWIHVSEKPKEERFWIFSHYINEVPVFERSTPYEYRAQQRIKELKDWYGYTKAFYSNELPENYFS